MGFGRFAHSVNHVSAGAWSLIEGIDGSIRKTATLTAAQGNDDASTFSPLRFDNCSVVKVAVEPLQVDIE